LQKFRYLDFHNQSAQDIPLPRTRWNIRILFRVGFYHECQQNLTWQFNTVETRIRTRLPVNRFQKSTIETRAVFLIDQIVRSGSFLVNFVRGTLCVNPGDQRYFDQAPTYKEWLLKQEQIPSYFVVKYVRQKNPNQQNWRDRALPRWLFTVSIFEGSPTGRLVEDSKEIENTLELALIHNKKVHCERS
jgi:hypothetical protein